MDLKIAKRYAQSLFELLDDNKKVESAIKKLHDFLLYLGKYPKSQSFIFNDYTSIETKSILLNAITQQVKLDKKLTNFLSLLVKNTRIKHLESIVDQLQKMHDDKAGVMPVDVVVAGTVDDSQVKNMKKVLKAEFNKEINEKIIVDKNIIGGLQFKTEGLLYDASVQTALKNLKKSI